METFILHYANATHLPAETFLNIKGVESAYEDEIIVMDPDERGEVVDKKNFGTPVNMEHLTHRCGSWIVSHEIYHF